ANALRSFDGPLALHDEVEVLAVLVEMVRRGSTLLVTHDPREHVVYLCQLLVDEESALSPRYGRDQLRQLVLVKNVCHRDSPLNVVDRRRVQFRRKGQLQQSPGSPLARGARRSVWMTPAPPRPR